MTNYKKRYNLLKCRLDRVVFRVSTKYAYASITKYNPKGDIVLNMFSTKQFGKFKKNKEVCFKLGQIVGKYIESTNNPVILDIGQRKFNSGKVVNFAKGISEVTNYAKINMQKILKYND